MSNLAVKLPNKKTPPKKIMKQIIKLQKTGHYKDSLQYCNKLVKNGYETPELLHCHGLALRAWDDFQGALLKIHSAHEMRPEDPEILTSLGIIFFDLKEYEAAIELLKRSTQLDEKSYLTWKCLGIALRMVERYEAAEIAFTYARHLDPSQVEPVLNMIVMLNNTRAYDKAKVLLDDLLKYEKNRIPSILLKRLHVAARLQDLKYIEDNYHKIERSGLNLDEKAEIDNIWAYYLELNFRYDEAIDLLNQWADKKTVHQDLINSFLGICYGLSGRIDEGLAQHEKILQQNPDHIAGRYNLANLQFKKGLLKEAYANYESRWDWWEFSSKRRLFDAPRWKGEPLKGKKLLVWREQGIGDEVCYSSLLVDLKEMGGDVTFECSPKLMPLWGHSFPWLTLRDEGETDCRSEAAYAEFDYQIPLKSLCAIFRPDFDSFLEKQQTWIERFPNAENQIRDQLEIKSDEILVGVCLRSGYTSEARNPSFVTSEQFAPLKQLQNVKWLNVQYDNTTEELSKIRDLGIDLHHYLNLDQKQDLVGACTLIGACDIVISVGVSVADMAAGLGVPVLHIAREHSEIYLGTDHIPWYPSAKAYQMPPNGGSGVVGKILEEWPDILKWANEITSSDRSIPIGNDNQVSSDSINRIKPEKLNLEYTISDRT